MMRSQKKRKPGVCSPAHPAHAHTYSQISTEQFANGADVIHDNTETH